MRRCLAPRRSELLPYPLYPAGLFVRDGQDLYPGEGRVRLHRSLAKIEVHCDERLHTLSTAKKRPPVHLHEGSPTSLTPCPLTWSTCYAPRPVCDPGNFQPHPAIRVYLLDACTIPPFLSPIPVPSMVSQNSRLLPPTLVRLSVVSLLVPPTSPRRSTRSVVVSSSASIVNPFPRSRPPILAHSCFRFLCSPDTFVCP